MSPRTCGGRRRPARGDRNPTTPFRGRGRRRGARGCRSCQPARLADTAGAGTSATSPGVSTGDNGDTLVTWLQPVGSYAHVFARERRGGRWQAPVDVSDIVNPTGLDCSGQQSAMNAGGDTVLVWAQATAGAEMHIFGREYRNGSWVSIGRLDPGDGYSADNPRVAIDDAGLLACQDQLKCRPTLGKPCHRASASRRRRLNYAASICDRSAGRGRVTEAARHRWENHLPGRH